MSEQQGPSLQEILKRRQRQEFVGREEEVSFFRENLAFSVDDERRRFVFTVYGQGGVGKTSLLRRFFQLAQHLGLTPGWTDETQEDVLAVMSHVVEQLDPDHHAFKTFVDRYHSYQRKCQELASDPKAPKGSFATFATQTLTKVGLRVGRRIPVGGAVFDVMNDDDVTQTVNEWVSYMKSKLTNAADLRLIHEPLEVLTPLFLAGLQKQTKNKITPLFFDTYERTSDYLDDWLRGLLAGRYGEVPPNIVLVISGRSELNKDTWVPYKELLAKINLEVFTEQEARLYLARKAITDERVVDMILHLSGRLPLLVATLATEHPHDPTQVSDPSETAVDRFLKWVIDPLYRSLVLNAALPRSFNRDLLVEVVGDQDVHAFFTWLKAMPFVKEQRNDWRFHEVVRDLMLRHTRRESPQQWSDIHGHLAEYFEKQLGKKGIVGEQTLASAHEQTLLLEAIYHRLCQSPRQEMRNALNGFFTTFTLDESFSLHWAEAMLQAGEECAEMDVEYWGNMLINVTKAYNERRYEAAIDSLTLLLNCTMLDDQSLSVAYAWRGLVYLEIGQHESSLKDMNASLDTYPSLKTDSDHSIPSFAYISSASSLTPEVAFLFVLFVVLFLLGTTGNGIAGLFSNQKKDAEPQTEMLDGEPDPVEHVNFDEDMIGVLRESLTRLVKRKLTDTESDIS